MAAKTIDRMTKKDEKSGVQKVPKLEAKSSPAAYRNTICPLLVPMRLLKTVKGREQVRGTQESYTRTEDLTRCPINCISSGPTSGFAAHQKAPQCYDTRAEAKEVLSSTEYGWL